MCHCVGRCSFAVKEKNIFGSQPLAASFKKYSLSGLQNDITHAKYDSEDNFRMKWVKIINLVSQTPFATFCEDVAAFIL